MATDPEGSWVFIVDNLNIHCSESLVKLVAEACEVPKDLGKKGVRGVLKSVASRQAFLTEPSHRIRFVYLPKHSSWLTPAPLPHDGQTHSSIDRTEHHSGGEGERRKRLRVCSQPPSPLARFGGGGGCEASVAASERARERGVGG